MVRVSVAAVLVLLSAAAPAAAQTLRITRAVERDCVSRLLPEGAHGVARVIHSVGGDALLRVRLTAARGDWDVALFDARTGARRGGSAGFGSRELVHAPVKAGSNVVVQACRRTGTSSSARLAVRSFALPSVTREPVQLLRVVLRDEADHARLEATGLDVTHNHRPGFADVVTYSAAERALLLAGGFAYSVLEDDLAAETRRTLRLPGAPRRALPSGRTDYRLPADYQADLKKIVDEHPGLARRILIGESLEGRPIEGVELAKDVARSDDGRPTFVVMGLHHAREWPAGEMPMEFGLDVAESYGTDARVTALLDAVRVIVLPVINPDGFEVSRMSPEMQSLESGAYKRKNCRPTAPGDTTPCALRVHQGVDLNRNYGAYWGGIGSSPDPTAQNHRGPSPYSEPESEAVHKLSQTRNIVTIITHHTYTNEGMWLRQPGFCFKNPGQCSDTEDVVPDEAGMAALGDAMGEASGWNSLLGWKIGEITGATEDWNYFAAGAYGYTPEQRGENFHSAFATTVADEYTGAAPGANGGVREALLRAGEQARDRTWHSVVIGSAPAGATLRLRKAFDTATMADGVVVKDVIDQTLTVPANGRFVWDINPSTRPLSGAPEAYEMTCAVGGTVRETKQVFVERGHSAIANFPCDGSGGGTVTGVPTPPGGVLPTGAPPASPSSAKQALSIRRARASGRRLRVGLRATGGALRNVRVTVSRRGRRVASARSSRLTGSRTITIRLKRGLRRGAYVVRASARTAAGKSLTARRTLRIR